MSFTSRKSQFGQSSVQYVKIYLDQCRYAKEASNIAYRSGTLTETFDFGYIGPVAVTANAGWYSRWAWALDDVYVKIDDEVMKIDIASSSASSLFIVERGSYGTAPADHNAGTYMQIMHKGELDGTCRGYAQTCTSGDAYHANSKIVLRASNSPLPPESGVIDIPGLIPTSIRRQSTEAKIGESIGTRARLQFNIQDIQDYTDDLNPWPEKRYRQGRIMSKLLARNPYFDGRTVEFYDGLRDYGTITKPESMTSTYIIDSVQFSNGVMSFACLDPLILTNEKAAKMPVLSNSTITADIADSGVATITYTSEGEYYFGPMSSVAYVCIDNEIMECAVTGPYQLTSSTRGYKSQIAAHSAGATIQKCYRRADIHGIDLFVDALTYTQIPSSLIGNYAGVKASMSGFNFSEVLLHKPTEVSKVLDEIIKTGNLICYFDNESTNKLVIDYVPEMSVNPIDITDTESMNEISIAYDDKNQFTRYSALWGKVDYTKDTEENYAYKYLGISTLETPRYIGISKERPPFKSMFFTGSTGDTQIVTSYIARAIESSQNTPKIIKFHTMASQLFNVGSNYIGIGSVINVLTNEVHDIDGSPIAELYQVTRIDGDVLSGFDVTAKIYTSPVPTDIDFVLDAGVYPNFKLTDYITMTPRSEPYKIYLPPESEFTTISSAPAFDIGPVPSGVSVHLIHRGRILSRGGDGGNGSVYAPDRQGKNGFDCLNITCPTTIDCGEGLIWAGGGGGSGYTSGSTPLGTFSYGGGGGQGIGTAYGGYNGGVVSGRAQNGIRNGPGQVNINPISGGTMSLSGGEWGEAGKGPTAGLAGIAIKSNGNPVTIVSGDNNLNIKGRRT